MTGNYTYDEIRNIAERFASQLNNDELHDIAQAIIETCYAAAQACHCSPHWIDLNAIGAQLAFLSMDRKSKAHEIDESLWRIIDADQPGADVPAGRADRVGE